MSSRNRHGNNNSIARLFWQQLMRIFRSPNKICPIWAKDINPACYARYSSICLMFLIIFFSLLLFHTGRTKIKFYSRFKINFISSGVPFSISEFKYSIDRQWCHRERPLGKTPGGSFQLLRGLSRWKLPKIAVTPVSSIALVHLAVRKDPSVSGKTPLYQGVFPDTEGSFQITRGLSF